MNMNDIPEISLEEAKAHLDAGSATFLDIRDPGSFARSHIQGAKHIADPSEMDRFIDDGDSKQTVIVYCYHGNSSLGGAGYLMDNGFEDVYSMRGGFEEWRKLYGDGNA